MASENGDKWNKLNGHRIPIIIACIQVVITTIVTLAGVGLFVRSIEQTWEARFVRIEKKVDLHMVVSKRNPLSIAFHHTLGVSCTKGCHIDRSAEFGFEPNAPPEK